MAATDFVEEIRSVGERLLLKLKELPQAEPVELVAFSIIVLFTGKWGICPRTLWLCPPALPSTWETSHGASWRAGQSPSEK